MSRRFRQNDLIVRLRSFQVRDDLGGVRKIVDEFSLDRQFHRGLVCSGADALQDVSQVLGDRVCWNRNAQPWLPREGRETGHMQPLWFSPLITVAVSLGSCSPEATYTEQERSCIAQRYSNYNAKQLSQCVDVCKACAKGNDVTCNTSCKLKGAS